MASSSTGRYLSTVHANEPMVRSSVTHGDYSDHTAALWVNTNRVDTNDCDRLRAMASGVSYYSISNAGWGLGTAYDYEATRNGRCSTMRPMSDAQMHSGVGGVGSTWGYSGGIGAQLGTDDKCNSGCPWTVESGYSYDYAIFVSES